MRTHHRLRDYALCYLTEWRTIQLTKIWNNDHLILHFTTQRLLIFCLYSGNRPRRPGFIEVHGIPPLLGGLRFIVVHPPNRFSDRHGGFVRGQ